MLEAVLFDVGDTLVDFRRTEDALRSAYDRIRAVVVEAVADDRPVPHAHELIVGLADAVQQVVEASYAERLLQELDVVEVFDETLRAIGYQLPAEVVQTIVQLDHDAWWRSLSLPPSTTAALTALRERGVRTGFVSNAHFLPGLLRADLERLGLAALLDGGAFSSEVGTRKPDAAIFQHVLAQLGVEPDRAIMVGDRVLDDVEGARAAGMAGAVLTHQFRSEEPGGHELAVVGDLREVIDLVEDWGLSGSRPTSR